jgi:transposase
MRQVAGKSVIATDFLEAHPLAEDDVFRQLFELEAIFRQLKTTIEIGPLRHRRADRIEAHVMIAIMAQNLGRWLAKRAGMSLERLQLLFRNLRVQQVQMGEATYWERVELEAEQEAVIARLGYDAPQKRFTVTVPDA